LVTEAVFGLDVRTTHPVEFNNFENKPRDAEDLPVAPTLDMFVKLTTIDDFRWKLDNDTSLFVVCQLRKSAFHTHNDHYCLYDLTLHTL